jgi:hypothetical protein
LHAIEFQDTIKANEGDRCIQIEFLEDTNLLKEIEKILVKLKVLDTEKEFMSEPSVLIGGKQNQQYHVDIPRLNCSIIDKNDENFWKPGYKIN